MAGKQVQKVEGEKPQIATRKAAHSKTVYKLSDGTLVESGRITVKRRTYSPRERRCEECRTPFKPESKRAKYCSDTCRAKAYRKRKRAGQGKIVREVVLEPLVCIHCGQGFFAVIGKGAQFCTPTCRSGAYKARRKASVVALAADRRMSQEEAIDVIDVRGLAYVMDELRQRGWLYDYSARTWVLPSDQYVYAG